MNEDAKSSRLYDSRIVTRNIRKGLLTRKEYDKFLQALPDAADKIAPPEATPLPLPVGADGAGIAAPSPPLIVAHLPPPTPPGMELDAGDDDDLDDEDLEDDEDDEDLEDDTKVKDDQPGPA